MKTFPIMLRCEGLRGVVVGGGPVGLRKARALSRAGADITLIAPQERLPKIKGVKHIRAPYRRSFLADARLVMVCTADRNLNSRIASDARQAGALVNVADQPDDCDFYLPAVVADGDIVVAVGTGGQAPALAAGLKRIMAAALPRQAGRFASALSRIRRRLKSEINDAAKRMAVLRKISGMDGYKRFVAGGTRALWAMATRTARPAANGGPAPKAKA